MNYIITNEQYYKDIATSIRNKLKVDREYYPKDMADAISLIPSSADGSNELVCGVYFYDPDKEGYPRKYKNVRTDITGLSVDVNAKSLEIIEFTDSCFMTSFGLKSFSSMEKLREIRLPSSITTIDWTPTFYNLPLLKKINFPSSLKRIVNGAFSGCPNLEFVEIENGFNCDSLNLSFSNKYSRETIVSWLNALKDRTGEVPYKFIIGTTNLAKLTAEDIKIATDKNWTLA